LRECPRKTHRKHHRIKKEDCRRDEPLSKSIEIEVHHTCLSNTDPLSDIEGVVEGRKKSRNLSREDKGEGMSELRLPVYLKKGRGEKKKTSRDELRSTRNMFCLESPKALLTDLDAAFQ